MSAPKRDKRRSCDGKQRFVSWLKSGRFAKRMRRRHDEIFVAYYCKFCGGFHVGSRIE